MSQAVSTVQALLHTVDMASIPVLSCMEGHAVSTTALCATPRSRKQQRSGLEVATISSQAAALFSSARIAPLDEAQQRCNAAAWNDVPGPLRPGMVISSGSQEVDHEDFMEDGTGIRLECDESGCVLVMDKGNMPTLVEKEKPSETSYLRCNLSGCEYVSEEPEADFRVIEGEGWRLCYETAPSSEDAFSAAVGSKGWNVALTATEFNAFCELLQMLRKGIVTMSQDGIIGRDDVVLKVERSNVFMECKLPKKRLPSLQNIWKFGSGSGEKYAFDVTFILFGTPGQRQAEGYWPAEAVMDMLKKIDELSSAEETPALAPATQTAEVPTPAAV